MKIRSLTLENVRKFGGRRVTIDGIEDGISVISEANEFGKSTFFDALHALFYEKYGSTKKPIKSLQPHAGGGLRIAATIDVAAGLFEIEKRFLAKKGASVRQIDRDRVIARDDEAEAWIAAHVNASDTGPAGLLWVRQGVLGLEPADSKPAERDQLTEARRDLLSSVAGEIDQVTGGRTMDRILKRCEDDLGALATGARQSPKGPWKEAVDAQKALEAELASLQAHCTDLAGALDARRQLDAELRRVGSKAAIDARKADLDQARAGARAAQAHAQQCESAQRAADIADLELREVTRQRDALATAVTQAAQAAGDLDAAQRALETAQEKFGTAQGAETTARQAFATAETATATLRDEMKTVERHRAAARAQGDLARAQAALDEATRHVTAQSLAKAGLAHNPVTADRARAVEDAGRALHRAEAQAAAQRVSVTIAYDGQVRLRRDGTDLPGGAAIALAHGDTLTVPDVGEMRFSVPQAAGAAVDGALGTAQGALRQALADCDAATVEEVHDRLAARNAAEGQVALAESTLRVLAPEGIAALEAAVTEAEARIAQAPEGKLRSADAVEAELEGAVTAERAARRALDDTVEALTQARLALDRSATGLMQRQEAFDSSTRLAGPDADRAARLAQIETRVMQATQNRQRALNSLTALTAQAPDLETATANLTRAETAFETARKRIEDLRETRASLSAQIATRADQGVEERRTEVAGRLDAVSARAARYEAEVAALLRLRTELQAARNQARDAYFEPVQEELRPLLRILHDDAQLDWASDSILPGALHRGGAVEAFDSLSGGTQEQIAILTRLAFARLFARRGEHVPVILDDALVYSDDDRIVKMFTALNRVAARQQIIVFSCRQLAFAGLGGNRPRITVSEGAEDTLTLPS